MNCVSLLTEHISNNAQMLDNQYFQVFLVAVIILIIVYVIELFYYRRISRLAESIPFLSSISIQGDIRKEFDSRQADLLLFSHISQINKLYERTLEDHGTLYGEISEIRNVIVLPQRWKPPEFKLQQKKPIKIGPVEFYIQDVFNLLFWLAHILNPYIRKYSRLQIYVSLGAINEEMELIVVRPLLPKKSISSHNIRNGAEGAALTELCKIEDKRSLSRISAMLRDSAFMIFQLQLGESIPGHNWKGMKHFTDGLTLLELYSRTEGSTQLDNAISNFAKAALTGYENYDVLYLQGYLLLFKRTEDSINSAIIFLIKALKSQNHWLKALVNAALAGCYAQQVCRFEKHGIILNIAQKHLEDADSELKEAKDDNNNSGNRDLKYAEAKIISTKALVSYVKASILSESLLKQTEKRENYLTSVKQYFKAREIGGQNTNYSNAIGYIHLQFAKEGVNKLTKEEWVDDENKDNPAEIAEKFLLEALKIDPTNKLVYANLCLLYGTPWYIDKHYIDPCCYYGYTAIRLDPDYINGYFDLVSSLISYEKFEEASEVYGEVMKFSGKKEKKKAIRVGEKRIKEQLAELYKLKRIDESVKRKFSRKKSGTKK